LLQSAGHEEEEEKQKEKGMLTEFFVFCVSTPVL
jgi:hypothetical protein